MHFFGFRGLKTIKNVKENDMVLGQLVRKCIFLIFVVSKPSKTCEKTTWFWIIVIKMVEFDRSEELGGVGRAEGAGRSWEQLGLGS